MVNLGTFHVEFLQLCIILCVALVALASHVLIALLICLCVCGCDVCLGIVIDNQFQGITNCH